MGKKVGDGFGMASGWVWEAANFLNAGFWRLRAPETRILAPEGALDRISYIKGPKRANFHRFFAIFSIFYWANWLAVKKSAASAASLDGFSSRDPVGC